MARLSKPYTNNLGLYDVVYKSGTDLYTVKVAGTSMYHAMKTAHSWIGLESTIQSVTRTAERVVAYFDPRATP